ncbi:hypothetical protein ACNKHV_06235 [Shigella flexneri]
MFNTRWRCFGATVLMPILMGLDPNLSILCWGLAHYCFSLLPAGACPVIWLQRWSFVGVVIAATGFNHG